MGLVVTLPILGFALSLVRRAAASTTGTELILHHSLEGNPVVLQGAVYTAYIDVVNRGWVVLTAGVALVLLPVRVASGGLLA